MKLGSIVQILLLTIVISIYCVFSAQFDAEMEDGFFVFSLIFIIASVFVVIMILPVELMILFGVCKLIPKKGFRWSRLILLLLAGLEFFKSRLFNYYDYLPSWHGLQVNQLIAILYLIYTFLGRYNYYLITDRFIGDMPFGGLIDTIKIRWSKITVIEYHENKISIKADDKEIDIDLNKLHRSKRDILISLIKDKQAAHRTFPI